MLDIYVAKNNCLTKTKYDPEAWPDFSTELEEFIKLKIRFTLQEK